MKIGNSGNLVLGPFDESTPCLMIVLMNCQTKLRINHLTAVKSVAILERPVDPRDVIYTNTRLRTHSTDQWSRRPPHTKKCTRTANCFIGLYPGSLRPLRVLPLTPTHRRLRLEWYRGRGNWTAAEWNQVVFNDESRFNLSSDGKRVRVCRPYGERLNPSFALQRHTAPTAGVMVWGAIDYNTRSTLTLIRDTVTTQRYAHKILQPHVLPLMQWLPAVFFVQGNARSHTARVTHNCLHSVAILPLSPDPQICLQSSISGVIWDGELGISQV
ncbi:transposable element Tcb2 transposase [Trichonephila clavipes]|nr:transposable element Tcb2 transposase [Trichonephila clavipes]